MLTWIFYEKYWWCIFFLCKNENWSKTCLYDVKVDISFKRNGNIEEKKCDVKFTENLKSLTDCV